MRVLVNKKGFRAIVSEMVKTEGKQVVSEGAPKIMKSGRFQVESPENFKGIIVQGFGNNVSWQPFKVDTGKAEEFNYKKGVVEIQVVSTTDAQVSQQTRDKLKTGLGVLVTDNTATDGTLIIAKPMSTIQKVAAKFGGANINQELMVRYPQGVRVKSK